MCVVQPWNGRTVRRQFFKLEALQDLQEIFTQSLPHGNRKIKISEEFYFITPEQDWGRTSKLCKRTRPVLVECCGRQGKWKMAVTFVLQHAAVVIPEEQGQREVEDSNNQGKVTTINKISRVRWVTELPLLISSLYCFRILSSGIKPPMSDLKIQLTKCW